MSFIFKHLTVLLFVVPALVAYLGISFDKFDETKSAMIYLPKERGFYEVRMSSPIENWKDLGPVFIPFWDRKFHKLSSIDNTFVHLDDKLKLNFQTEEEIYKRVDELRRQTEKYLDKSWKPKKWSSKWIADVWLLPRSDLDPIDLLPPEWVQLPNYFDNAEKIRSVDVVFWRCHDDCKRSSIRTIQSVLYIPPTLTATLNGFCFSSWEGTWEECIPK